MSLKMKQKRSKVKWFTHCDDDNSGGGGSRGGDRRWYFEMEKWLEAWIYFMYTRSDICAKDTSQHDMHWALFVLFTSSARSSSFAPSLVLHQFKVLCHLPFNGDKLCDSDTYAFTATRSMEWVGRENERRVTHITIDSLEASIWPHGRNAEWWGLLNEEISLLFEFLLIHLLSLALLGLALFASNRFRSSHNWCVFDTSNRYRHFYI